MSTISSVRTCVPHNSVQTRSRIQAQPRPCARLTGVSTPVCLASTRSAFNSGFSLDTQRTPKMSAVSRQPIGIFASNLVIQGKNIEVTDSIRAYAEEKVLRAVEKFESGVKEIDVSFSTRGGASHKNDGGAEQKVEVTAYTINGVIRVEEAEETLYASIDLVSDKLARKLRKMKEKGGKKKGSQKTNTDRQLSEEATMLVDLDLDRIPDLPKEVVRTKYVNASSMSVEDAIENMAYVGHDFYTFTNEDTGDICIVYKRKMGGVGLIVPTQK